MTELITIAELIGKGSFCIPKYQRGYRWTQDEVEKLLNDIYEFNADGTEANEYYCLQPIVVKKKQRRRVPNSRWTAKNNYDITYSWRYFGKLSTESPKDKY